MSPSSVSILRPSRKESEAIRALPPDVLLPRQRAARVSGASLSRNPVCRRIPQRPRIQRLANGEAGDPASRSQLGPSVVDCDLGDFLTTLSDLLPA